MTNPRNDAASADRVLTPLQGLALAIVLSLVAFWLPVLTLVGDKL